MPQDFNSMDRERDKKINQLISLAKKNLGKPYKYGAKPSVAPKVFDCSSFTQYLYKKIGIDLPRAALEQASMGSKVKDKTKIEAGDLLFFKGVVGRYNPQFPQGIGHVAICISNEKALNAKYRENKDGSDGGSVEECTLKELLKRKDIVVIKRII